MTDYSNRFACYMDIIEGTALFLIFVATQLAMWNLLPAPSLLMAIPQAPAFIGLAPLTQGDLVVITLLTGYGAIWGLRMVSDALQGLRNLTVGVLGQSTASS